MKLVQEFKNFAIRGNVIDMAVGIIIGTAFNKIVSSFVADVVMPPLGVMLGQVNFRDLTIVLQQAVGEQAEVTLRYGLFIQNVIDFIIVAFAVFIGVRAMNTMRRKESEQPEIPVSPPADIKLLTEIRDLLKHPPLNKSELPPGN